MRYTKNEYFDIMKDTLDNLAIKNKYKLNIYDEILYYRLFLNTTETSFPKKAMTLTIDTHCLKQLLNYYNQKELTKDDLIMFISYITYNNIYNKCQEYLENATDEIGNNNGYVIALIKLRDKAENKANSIYFSDKKDILYRYQLIIEDELLDYPYFDDIN